MEASANVLNANSYRKVTSRTISIIGTIFLIVTMFVQFITVDIPYVATSTAGSYTLFGFLDVSATPTNSFLGILIIVAYIAFAVLFVISDIIWTKRSSQVLSIIGLIGSALVLIAYAILLPVANHDTFNGTLTFSFGFYLWAIAIVLEFASLILNNRKIKE